MQTLNTTQILWLIGVFAVVFATAFGVMHVFAPRDLQRRIEQAGGTNIAFGADKTSELPEVSCAAPASDERRLAFARCCPDLFRRQDCIGDRIAAAGDVRADQPVHCTDDL
jgi:hypothetical protein